MSELKPCAHCGGLALLVPSGRKRVWVSCTACKVSTQEVHELKARKAVKAWNTRDTSAIEAAVLRRVADIKMKSRDGSDGPFFSLPPGSRATLLAEADRIEKGDA